MSRIAALIHFDESPSDAGLLRTMVQPASAGADVEPDGSIDSEGSRAVAGDGGARFVSEDGTLELAADCRIDNRTELAGRAGLGDGRWTDIDVVAASYRRWGERFAPDLVGDFAIVALDRARRRVVMARDPMGMRPLYFRYEPSRRLIVASTVAAILEVPGVPNEIDEVQLAAFLHGPVGLPDRSFHRGISQVRPGETIVVPFDGVAPQYLRWRPDPDHRIRLSSSEMYEEELRSLLLEAVRCRVGSQGTTALLLSGGVDSGAVASATGVLMDRDGIAAPRAYGWGFDELSDSDESGVSARLAQHHGLPYVRLRGDDAFPLADHPHDGPALESPAMWPWNALLERTYVRVAADGAMFVMTGASGDEVIGDAVWDLTGLLRAGRFGAIAERVRGVADQSGLSLVRSGRQLVRAGLRVPTSSLEPTLGPALREPELDLRAEQRDEASQLHGRGRQQRHERIFGYAAQQLRSLGQRQMAAHGLVHVDPWTDRRLVEWILAVPQHEVTRPDRPKDLVRRAITPWLPPSHEFVAGAATLASLRDRGILDRRRTVIDGIVASSELVERGYVDRSWLGDLWSRETGGRPDVQFEWVLAAELWLRRHWTDSGGYS